MASNVNANMYFPDVGAVRLIDCEYCSPGLINPEVSWVVLASKLCIFGSPGSTGNERKFIDTLEKTTQLDLADLSFKYSRVTPTVNGFPDWTESG